MRLRVLPTGIAAGLLWVLATAPPGRAQTRLGAEFQVNTYTTGLQRYGVVAASPDGRFVVAWTSYGQDGSGGGIFARRFDHDGTPLGVEFRVNTYTTSDQSLATLASDAQGNFVVVWRSFPQDGSNVGVFGQRFDAAGAALGAEFQVNTYTTGYQGTPAVAAGAGGAFVVVWASSSGPSNNVFGQRFDASGNRLGGEFLVNAQTGGLLNEPGVAVTSDGGFVVSWSGYGIEDTSSSGVLARRFDADGGPLGGPFLVNTTTTDRQFMAAVTSTGDGGFVVSWTGRDASYYGIFAQQFDASGNRRGAELKVDTFVGNQTRPSLAAQRRGNFDVVWLADFQDGDGGAVTGRRISASGVPRGGEFAVNTSTAGNQLPTRRPSAIASDGAGHFVVTWHGPGDGSIYGILAQRFGGPAIFTSQGGPQGRSRELEVGCRFSLPVGIPGAPRISSLRWRCCSR
jgi:hypothetical protein